MASYPQASLGLRFSLVLPWQVRIVNTKNSDGVWGKHLRLGRIVEDLDIRLMNYIRCIFDFLFSFWVVYLSCSAVFSILFSGRLYSWTSFFILLSSTTQGMQQYAFMNYIWSHEVRCRVTCGQEAKFRHNKAVSCRSDFQCISPFLFWLFLYLLSSRGWAHLFSTLDSYIFTVRPLQFRDTCLPLLTATSFSLHNGCFKPVPSDLHNPVGNW